MGQFTPIALKVAQGAAPSAAPTQAPASAAADERADANRRRDLLQRQVSSARAAAGAAGTAGVGGSAEAILAGLREQEEIDLANDQRARLLRPRRATASAAAIRFGSIDLGSGLDAINSMID